MDFSDEMRKRLDKNTALLKECTARAFTILDGGSTAGIAVLTSALFRSVDSQKTMIEALVKEALENLETDMRASASASAAFLPEPEPCAHLVLRQLGVLYRSYVTKYGEEMAEDFLAFFYRDEPARGVGDIPDGTPIISCPKCGLFVVAGLVKMYTPIEKPPGADVKDSSDK